jgi:hypothetical protein
MADDARFCARCGTPKPEPKTGDTKEFTIPLPEDSPVSGPLGVGQKDMFLTRPQLAKIGITRPQAADFMYFKGLTYIWKHHAAEITVRLSEIEAEGWELDEEFEPASDFYGVVTTQGIRDRFVLDETKVTGMFGLKPAFILTGFRFRMRRAIRTGEGANK